MTTDLSKQRGFRLPFVLVFLATLALLALACAPAAQPTAAPEATAAPAAPEATAAPVATSAPSTGEVPTTGKHIETAGLRIFIPTGFVFGGPIIPPDPRQPRYGGIAVHAMAGDPPSLDPYHTTGTYTQQPTVQYYERLVHYSVAAGTDPFNSPIIPGLAESWGVSDDFLTYTFHLRKGVKFHNLPPVNGREMDAEDVKATWDLFMSAGSVIKPYFAKVDRVEVIDRYTVALHMKEVDPGMLTTLSELIRGYILPRELADPASRDRRLAGIGTGPFMADAPYEFKVGVRYKRNPDYWGFDEGGNRLPYVDGVSIVVMPDHAARLTAFRTGKIDWGATVGDPTAMRALLRTNPTTLVQEYVAPSVGFYAFRLDRAPWSDVRVRRAFSMALDYETTAQTLFGSSALGLGSPVSGYWHGSDDRLTTVTKVCECPWYTYDPQRAKALLAEAGFPKGFSPDLVFFAYTQSTIEQSELNGAYWKAIGVDVKIKSQDYTVFRVNIDIAGWEALSYSFIFPAPSSIYSAMGVMIPGGPANPMAGLPNDPKLTALAKGVIAAYDKDEATRNELVRQTRAYYLDQVFTLPVVSGVTYQVMPPRMRNFQSFTSTVVNLHRSWRQAWIDDAWSFAR